VNSLKVNNNTNSRYFLFFRVHSANLLQVCSVIHIQFRNPCLFRIAKEKKDSSCLNFNSALLLLCRRQKTEAKQRSRSVCAFVHCLNLYLQRYSITYQKLAFLLFTHKKLRYTLFLSIYLYLSISLSIYLSLINPCFSKNPLIATIRTST
jgi:hypothetical protein